MRVLSSFLGFVTVAGFLESAVAQTQDASLTLYNQGFAVVRARIPLALKAGESRIGTSGITAHLEPESVILRDPSGKSVFRILEQNYRNDPVSQELLLDHFEGETIQFLVRSADGTESRVKGRVVRSGYVPHYAAFSQYGNGYYQTQMATAQSTQPIIEIDDRLRFGLPGEPLFPSLPNDSILKPRLEWVLESAEATSFDAELAYVSGGFSWAADYNVIAPEAGDVAELIGWVTMDNQSGTTFENASIKLMAGDVHKLRPDESRRDVSRLSMAVGGAVGGPAVTEKAFDEYHLYTVARPTTLRDREKKQVEFVRAAGMKSERFYVYDGAQVERYRGWDRYMIRDHAEYGTEMNTKVLTMLEFENSEANGLGIPLPMGRLRFYRRDSDGRLEFTGEDSIDHTPKDERVRVYVGNSFDLVGERVRTDYRVDSQRHTLDESFRIVVKNHKSEEVVVRVVEHLYRWSNWEIAKHSDDFSKRDAETAEFHVNVPADGEKVVEYTVHYWW